MNSATTLPAPPDLTQCPCCATTYTHAEWAALEWRPWPDLGLEIAECDCGSTMSRHEREDGQ